MTNQSLNDSLTKKGIIGAFWQTSASLIRILFQFLLLAILSRLISQTDFGYIAFIMIMVGFTDLFSRMGIGGALIQMDILSINQVRTGFTLSLLFGVILGLLFYFLTPNIASFFNMNEIIDGLHFFSFLFPIRALNSVSNSLLTRDLKYALVEKIHLFSFIFGYSFVAIILAYLDFGYWSLLYGQLAMVLLTSILSWFYNFPKFSLNLVKEDINQLLFFGSGHTINIFLGYFSDTIDNLMVSKFIGPQALGIYSKAYQLYSIPASLLGSVYNNVMFPILSKRKNNLKKLRDFYFFSISLNILILTPIGILIFFNSELIVRIILGPGWEGSIIILQILILSLPFRFGFRVNRSLLTSMGLVYKVSSFEFIFVICISTLCFLGFYIFGLPGVAFGVLLSSIVFFLVAFVYINKLLKVSNRLNRKMFYNFVSFNGPILIFCIVILKIFKPSIWILLGISILLIPIVIYLLFYNKKSVILTENNMILTNQIFLNLPIKIQITIKMIQLKFIKIISFLTIRNIHK